MERSQRYVVVSTNNNPDYMFYAKYMEHAWNKLGWGLCIMVTPDVHHGDLNLPSFFQPSNKPPTIIITLPEIKDLRKESIAQAGRLYAANYFDHDDTLLMTSDMDLLPLTDYWNPDHDKVTVYGHDLTWRSYYPMGYIAMKASEWRHFMKLTFNTEHDMTEDAMVYKHLTTSDNWESWWNWDWTMITDRMKPSAKDITFIDRGQIDIAGATLAKGRVDRYNWKVTMEQPDWIDAHCHNNNVMHPDKLNDFLTVFEKVYGKI